MHTKLFPLLAVCLIAIGIISCDVSGEESFDFKQGDSLAIVGGPGNDTLLVPRYRVTVDTTVTPNDTTMVEIPDTVSYYVKAFTINKTYMWSVDPNLDHSVYRDGEFVDVYATSNTTGSYTINIDNGKYQGSKTLVVVDTTAAP